MSSIPGVTRRRVLAGLLDLACMAGWIAVVAAAGFLLRLAGIAGRLSPLGLNVVGAVAVVVPITVALGVLEGGKYEATLGKQRFGLRVRRAAGPQLGIGRALLRNGIKVAAPWLFGQVAAVALATTNAPIDTDLLVMTGVSLLIPLVYVVSLFVGDRRPPYDLVAGSTVVGVAPARRSLD